MSEGKKIIKHASWRDEDVFALFPQAAPLFKSPENFDSKQLNDLLDAHLGVQYDAMQAVLSSQNYKDFLEHKDPHALAVVLHDLEDVLAEVRKTSVFTLLLPQHYTDQSEKLLQSTMNSGVKTQGVAGFINQAVVDIMHTVATIDERQLQDMIAQEPALKQYEGVLKRFHDTPIPDTQKLAKLSEFPIHEATEKFRKSDDVSLTKDQRKALFAEALVSMVQFKQGVAQASGYKDTLHQFANTNMAPLETMDVVTATTAKHIVRLTKTLMPMADLIDKKFPASIREKKYSVAEARDIVSSAYEAFDPQLGAVARRAFDEGWLHLSSSGVTNPHTIASAPGTQMQGAHPFVAMNYNGSRMDLLMVGHEMAHVISNYIVGQKGRILSQDASMMMQETFAHFGEELMQREMQRRAVTQQERDFVELFFLAKEIDSLGMVANMKYEQDLYQLVKDKGSKVTHKDIDKIYHKDFSHQPDIKKTDFRNNPGMWHMIAQAPHNIAVYPVSKIMASALYNAYEKSPDSFRQKYHEIMEAGNGMGVSQAWDSLTNASQKEQNSYVGKHIEGFGPRLDALKKRISAMPDAPKEPKQVNAAASDDAGTPRLDPPSAYPVVGHFSAKAVERIFKGAAKEPTKKDDWVSTAQSRSSNPSSIELK